MANSRLQKLFAYLRPHATQASLGILALLIVNGVGVYIPLLIFESTLRNRDPAFCNYHK